jgi:hypothetical protein
VGELCKAGGLRIAYHNHDFEFTSLDQQMDMKFIETDKTLLILKWIYIG